MLYFLFVPEYKCINAFSEQPFKTLRQFNMNVQVTLCLVLLCFVEFSDAGLTSIGYGFKTVICRHRGEILTTKDGFTMYDTCEKKLKVVLDQAITSNIPSPSFTLTLNISSSISDPGEVVGYTDIMNDYSAVDMDISDWVGPLSIATTDNTRCGMNMLKISLRSELGYTEFQPTILPIVKQCSISGVDLSVSIDSPSTYLYLHMHQNLMNAFDPITKVKVMNHDYMMNSLPVMSELSPYMFAIFLRKPYSMYTHDHPAIGPTDAILTLKYFQEFPSFGEMDLTDSLQDVLVNFTDSSLCGEAELIFMWDPLVLINDTAPYNNYVSYQVDVNCDGAPLDYENDCEVVPDESTFGTDAHFYQYDKNYQYETYKRYQQTPVEGWSHLDHYYELDTISGMGKLIVVKEFMAHLARDGTYDICENVNKFFSPSYDSNVPQFEGDESGMTGFSERENDLNNMLMNINGILNSFSITWETYFIDSIYSSGPQNTSYWSYLITYLPEISAQTAWFVLDNQYSPDELLVYEGNTRIQEARGILRNVAESFSYSDPDNILYNLREIIHPIEQFRTVMHVRFHYMFEITSRIQNIYLALLRAEFDPYFYIMPTDCVNDNDLIRYLDESINALGAFAMDYSGGEYHDVFLSQQAQCQYDSLKYFLWAGAPQVYARDLLKDESDTYYQHSGCSHQAYGMMPNSFQVYWKVENQNVYKGKMSKDRNQMMWRQVATCYCEHCSYNYYN